MSVKTVNTYRYRIFEKLAIDSDVKLTHLAIRYGLIKHNQTYMHSPLNSSLSHTIFRLGTWYGLYRYYCG